tara:strand:+ start:779 stop:1279 length:501 start_codon:yes stop_codon:yes gene_type:complete
MDIYNIAATLVGFLGLALAIDQNVRKRGAEKELKEIERRGKGPYLLAPHMDARVNGEQQNQIFQPQNDTLGKITSGEIITLILINQGEEVRNVTDNWDETAGIGTIQGKIIQSNDRAAQIVYRYDLTKHGEKFPIQISFETQCGLQLTHTYELIHGVCALTRIDPK